MASKEPVQLQAVKRLRYRNRAIEAGALFHASFTDARILVAIKKAKEPERVPGKIAPPPKSLAAKIAAFDHDGDGSPGGSSRPAPDPDIQALREAYAEKLGRRPFPGWGADELRKRMADAEIAES